MAIGLQTSDPIDNIFDLMDRWQFLEKELLESYEEEKVVQQIRMSLSRVPRNYQERLCGQALNGECSGVMDSGRFYHRCQENPQGELGCVYFQLSRGNLV